MQAVPSEPVTGLAARNARVLRYSCGARGVS